jgi:hypothetical protein
MEDRTVKSTTTALFLLVFVFGLGCGPGGDDVPATGESQPEEPTADVPKVEMLPTPFTAEQIRDEWVVGFNLTMLRKKHGRDVYQRWSVVDADADSLKIEYVTVDADGEPIAVPVVQGATWVGLRDHAAFPAATATREEVTRETPLGTLDGWVYTVREKPPGTVTEYFFAKQYPGAPVHTLTTREGEFVMEMSQIERNYPE